MNDQINVEKRIGKKEIEEKVFNAIIETLKKQSKTTILVRDQGYDDYVVMNGRTIKVHRYNYTVFVDIFEPGGGKPVTADIRFIDPATWAGKPETLAGNNIWDIAEKVARYVSGLEPEPHTIKILKCFYFDII
jgi:hypothetical protein